MTTIKTSHDYLTRIEIDRIKDVIADMDDALDLLTQVDKYLAGWIDDGEVSAIDKLLVCKLRGRITMMQTKIASVRKYTDDYILFGNFEYDI